MSRQGVDSVERALSLLKVFTNERSVLSLTDLATATGLYKSTVLRLTTSLETCGFMQRGDDRLYRLGPELWRLGLASRRDINLEELIRRSLASLVKSTQETASFYVREGAERVCLYRENSPRAVRHHLDEGQRLPLDRGAAARILMAWSEPDRAELQNIRDAGIAVSLGERDPEVSAVAVPVFDIGGGFRGALSVSALLTRFDDVQRSAASKLLRETAAVLSTHIPVPG